MVEMNGSIFIRFFGMHNVVLSELLKMD